MIEANTVLQDRYRIVSPINKGGMGAVYLAKDENLGVMVAVKQNFFTEDRLIEAFKQEARLLAGLRHPALPQVKDYFINLAGQFLVMEYIAGDDLGTIIEKRKREVEPEGEAKPFDVTEVVRWAEQLLDALDYIHTLSEPVIHRDIKPQNLKLASRNQIILLDFGLAKGRPLWMTRVTTLESLYGYTPNYAPLEQIRGAGTDPRSDLYALGATLYHLITGSPPVDAATRADAFIGGEPDPLPAANEMNPKVPHQIASVLMKAMEQHRNKRHASAMEMLEILRAAKLSTVIERTTREGVEPPRAIVIAGGEEDVWPTTEIDPLGRTKEEEERARQEAEHKEHEKAHDAREEAETKRLAEQEDRAREVAEQKRQREEEDRLVHAAERLEELREEQEHERKAREAAERFQAERDRKKRKSRGREQAGWLQRLQDRKEFERWARVVGEITLEQERESHVAVERLRQRHKVLRKQISVSFFAFIIIMVVLALAVCLVIAGLMIQQQHPVGATPPTPRTYTVSVFSKSLCPLL